MAAFLKIRPFAPRLSTRKLLLLFGLGLLTALIVLLLFARQERIQLDADALQAAEQMLAGIQELTQMRLELGYAIDPTLDPAHSGLIGSDFSDLTTTLGSLRAKQTSLNPLFAGLIVTWFKQAGLEPGDTVAVSLTGSFPALNLAVICACDVLQLRPQIFSSVGASTYGANLPDFTWLDMEKRLYERGLIHNRSRWLSLGGIVDTEGGLDGTGIALGEAAIARHGGEYVPEGDTRDVVRDLERRWQLYTESGQPKMFISVGGNVTALGWVSEAALLGNGLIRHVPSVSSAQRGLIFRFVEAGVPVINLLNIESLAAQYQLPLAPETLETQLDLAQRQQRQIYWLAGLFAGWLGLIILIRRPWRSLIQPRDH